MYVQAITQLAELKPCFMLCLCSYLLGGPENKLNEQNVLDVNFVGHTFGKLGSEGGAYWPGNENRRILT
jgi:hypothetical protein